jgi:hypothetical protein
MSDNDKPYKYAELVVRMAEYSELRKKFEDLTIKVAKQYEDGKKECEDIKKSALKAFDEADNMFRLPEYAKFKYVACGPVQMVFSDVNVLSDFVERMQLYLDKVDWNKARPRQQFTVNPESYFPSINDVPRADLKLAEFTRIDAWTPEMLFDALFERVE